MSPDETSGGDAIARDGRARARAIAVILEGFRDPPHRVPLIVVDLGARDREEALVDLALLRSSGLTIVRTLDGEVYPARHDMVYRYTTGETPYTGELTVKGPEQRLAHRYPFQVADAWTEMELLWGFAVIAIGNARLAELGTESETLAEGLQRGLADGLFVGATISRDPREGDEPLYPPSSWNE